MKAEAVRIWESFHVHLIYEKCVDYLQSYLQNHLLGLALLNSFVMTPLETGCNKLKGKERSND